MSLCIYNCSYYLFIVSGVWFIMIHWERKFREKIIWNEIKSPMNSNVDHFKIILLKRSWETFQYSVYSKIIAWTLWLNIWLTSVCLSSECKWFIKGEYSEEYYQLRHKCISLIWSHLLSYFKKHRWCCILNGWSFRGISHVVCQYEQPLTFEAT